MDPILFFSVPYKDGAVSLEWILSDSNNCSHCGSGAVLIEKIKISAFVADHTMGYIFGGFAIVIWWSFYNFCDIFLA